MRRGGGDDDGGEGSPEPHAADPMLRVLARFLRIHLLPTAWADICAGAYGAGDPGAAALFPVLILSSCLYLFGMASNDILDAASDARLYPSRPIPSGRLGIGLAAAIAALLLAAAAAAAVFVAARSAVLAAILLCLILAYNAGGKRIAVVGPLLMGSCRAANVLLGTSIAGEPGTLGATAAATLGAYVACVALASSWEGAEVPLARLRVLMCGLAAFPAGLLAWARGIEAAPAVALLAIIALSIPRRGYRAGAADERLVRNLLAGIYLIDACFLGMAGAAALCGLATGAGVASFVAAAVLRRQARR